MTAAADPEPHSWLSRSAIVPCLLAVALQPWQSVCRPSHDCRALQKLCQPNTLRPCRAVKRGRSRPGPRRHGGLGSRVPAARGGSGRQRRRSAEQERRLERWRQWGRGAQPRPQIRGLGELRLVLRRGRWELVSCLVGVCGVFVVRSRAMGPRHAGAALSACALITTTTCTPAPTRRAA